MKEKDFVIRKYWGSFGIRRSAKPTVESAELTRDEKNAEWVRKKNKEAESWL